MTSGLAADVPVLWLTVLAPLLGLALVLLRADSGPVRTAEALLLVVSAIAAALLLPSVWPDGRLLRSVTWVQLIDFRATLGVAAVSWTVLAVVVLGGLGCALRLRQPEPAPGTVLLRVSALGWVLLAPGVVQICFGLGLLLLIDRGSKGGGLAAVPLAALTALLAAGEGTDRLSLTAPPDDWWRMDPVADAHWHLLFLALAAAAVLLRGRGSARTRGASMSWSLGVDALAAAVALRMLPLFPILGRQVVPLAAACALPVAVFLATAMLSRDRTLRAAALSRAGAGGAMITALFLQPWSALVLWFGSAAAAELAARGRSASSDGTDSVRGPEHSSWDRAAERLQASRSSGARSANAAARGFETQDALLIEAGAAGFGSDLQSMGARISDWFLGVTAWLLLACLIAALIAVGLSARFPGAAS